MSLDPNRALQAGAAAAQAVLAITNGDAIGAAAHAIDAVLELIPKEQAMQLLDERAVARAEAFRQMENDLKFGPKSGG